MALPRWGSISSFLYTAASNRSRYARARSRLSLSEYLPGSPLFLPAIRFEIRSRDQLQPVGPYYSVSLLRLLSSLQDRARRWRSAAGTRSSSKQIYESELLDMLAMSGRQPSCWLRSYFTAFVTVLDQYRPVAPYP